MHGNHCGGMDKIDNRQALIDEELRYCQKLNDLLDPKQAEMKITKFEKFIATGNTKRSIKESISTILFKLSRKR